MKTTALLYVVAFVAAIGIAPPVFAAEKAQTFVDKAAVGAMFEVESSKLALQRSNDPDVKKFADTIISDHGKTNAELKELARQQGLSVPAHLDDEHAAMLKELSKAGEQFEAPYLKAQLDGHERAVRMFQEYADNGDNEALQNFAVKTLPTLNMHLDMAYEIGNRVGAVK